MKIKVYFDGAIDKNPGGTAYYGFYIIKDDKILISRSGYVGHGELMSNNVAEHAAVISAMQYLKINGLNEEEIVFYGDSLMVCNQMTNKGAENKKGLYVGYFKRAKMLKVDFPNIKFQWIPREQNYVADALSKNTKIFEEHLENNNKFHEQLIAF